MKDKITAFVKKNNLIKYNDTVLIAFSGGADSVFLAHYLLSIKDEYNLVLKIAHVEHGIRGEESIRDCEFSAEFARNNNIEFFELHIDAVNDAEKAGIGVEEYSRLKRYEFFSTIKCDKIATAHNLSDNIETMLFRIARGTSLHGLCSIPVRRDNIIRPLLCVSGDEIREYLYNNKTGFCNDSTNFDVAYSRNRIRNIIIPELKKINSGFIANASRLLNGINETEAVLSELTDEKYSLVIKDNKLIINSLDNQNNLFKKRLIVKYFKANNLFIDELHLNNILKLLNKPGKEQVKENIYAVSDGEFLRIAEFNTIDFDKLIVNNQIMPVNIFLNNCELLNKQFAFYCDCDKINGNVRVRKRLEGDRISPENRNCTKTLKKLFNEYHIPVENRNNIPILYDADGIIGIYGYCKDKRVSVDDSTKKVLVINIRLNMEDKN